MLHKSFIMFKKRLYFLLIFSLFSFNNVFADISKYSKLNKLEFDIYRNNKLIGYHIYDFVREGKDLLVKSKIFFQIKKLERHQFFAKFAIDFYAISIRSRFSSLKNLRDINFSQNLQLIFTQFRFARVFSA